MGLQDFFMQKKIKEKKALLERNFGSFGKVVEQDNKILVFVSQDFVEGKNYLFFKSLFDIDYIVGHNKMCEYYYGYSIHFYFNDLTFSKNTKICISNTNAHFSHCFFEGDISIYNRGTNVFLNNNRCYGYLCVKPLPYDYRVGVKSSCTIKNDEMKNCFDDTLIKGLMITSDEVNIISSNLHVNQATINSHEMAMRDSKILSEGVISLDVNSMRAKDCLIQSKSAVMIDNKCLNFDGKVEAPIYFYNNDDLSPKVVDEKKNARKDFVMVLGQIRDSLNKQNQEKTLSFQKEFGSQKVGKLLIK